MAVMTAVLAPMLLRYVSESRKQKDASAMDEVVNTIKLATTDANIYDELISYSSYNNVSCYIDKKTEAECSDYRVNFSDEPGAYTFESGARKEDEVEYSAAGVMRGVTITFHPEADKNEINLNEGIINKWMRDKGKFVDNKQLFARVSSTLDTKVEVSSPTYRNSDFTVFIRIGSTGGRDQSKQKAISVYGQWNGTNLADRNIDFIITPDRETNTTITPTQEKPFQQWETPLYTEGDLRGDSNLTFNPDDADIEDKSTIALTIDPNTGMYKDSFKKTFIMNDQLKPFEMIEIENPTKDRATFAGWEYTGDGYFGFLEEKTDKNLSQIKAYNGGGKDYRFRKINTQAELQAISAPDGVTTVAEMKVVGPNAGDWAGQGGFTHFYQTKPNQSFIHAFIAKIPDGITVNCKTGSDAYGESGTWLTQNKGTGKWEYYAKLINCGTGGSFLDGGRVSIRSGLDYTDETKNKWYVAESKIYNVSKGLLSASNIYIHGTKPATLKAKWNNNIVSNNNNENLSTKLCAGLSFNNSVKKWNFTKVLFTDKIMPYGSISVDVSEQKDKGVLAWIEGETLVVSSVRPGKKIEINSDASYMFENFTKVTDIDIRNLSTVGVKTMTNMFANCYVLKNIDISAIDMSNVTTVFGLFKNCQSLNTIPVENWDTSKFTEMSELFAGCSAITTLNLSNWDMSNVKSIASMFLGCTQLKELNVSGWNLQKINNMSNTFKRTGLQKIDISTWKLPNSGVFAYRMFESCQARIILMPLSPYRVQATYSMFYSCAKLESINLSQGAGFEDMNTLFRSCTSLKSIVMPKTKIYINAAGNTFKNCISLETLDLSMISNMSIGTINNMLNNTTSLKRIIVGSEFRFTDIKGDNANLPQHEGFTWVNVDTGEQYKDSSTMPDFVAATYELRPIK